MPSPTDKSMYAQILASAHSGTAPKAPSLTPAQQNPSPGRPDGPPPSPAGKGEAPPAAGTEGFPVLLESFRYRYQFDEARGLSPLVQADESRGSGTPSVLMHAAQDVRIFHGRAFVQEIGRLAEGLSPQAAAHLRNTGRELERAVSEGALPKHPALEQFARQSGALAGQGEDALAAYLAATDGLVQDPGAGVGRFFGEVDALLDAGDHTQIQKAMLAIAAKAGPAGGSG